VFAREHDFDGAIGAASQASGVPVALLKAVIGAESAFNPTAYRAEAPRASLPPTADFPMGGDASFGLMQLLSRTARGLGYAGPLDGLYDPETNVRLGAQLLAQGLDRGSVSDSVSAYNGGWRPTLGFGSPMADGTYGNQGYVNKVLSYLSYFQGPDGTGGDDLTIGGTGSEAGALVPWMLVGLGALALALGLTRGRR
jgi:soluble lytic murein transglycosylase-like protein